MFDLSSSSPRGGLACVAHSEWTHLGNGKDCDICKLAKMRESPHFAVDHETAKELINDREVYFKKIRFLENILKFKGG